MNLSLHNAAALHDAALLRLVVAGSGVTCKTVLVTLLLPTTVYIHMHAVAV
jgi:hypothetical protein